MANITGLCGKRVGSLTVLENNSADGSSALWKCQCDCGNIVVVIGHQLTMKRRRSCGCRRRASHMGNYKHGLVYLPEYRVWQSAKDRILNPKCKQYEDYGGRGLLFEKDWLDFETFYKEIGPRPFKRYTLERRNNDLGYVRGNVVWESRENQAINKRNNIWLTHNGKKQVLAHWAREVGISKGVLADRLKLGWSVERALTEKVRPMAKKIMSSP